MRVALAQLNFRVGDLEGNKDKILSALSYVEAEDVELCLFPELALCGYPPEDLLLKGGFIQECKSALDEIASQSKTCTALVGCPLPSEKPLENDKWPALYNSVAVLRNGSIEQVVKKSHLPNYAVFDEHRYFVEGAPSEPIVVDTKQDGAKVVKKVGVAICEDLWVDGAAVSNMKKMKPDLVAQINASPYYAGKNFDRCNLLARRATEFRCPVVSVNLIGGQDELVFDGGSMAIDYDGAVIAMAEQFKEDIFIFDLNDAIAKKTKNNLSAVLKETPREEEIYEALVLGTRDYVKKNGFEEVVIGMSGGIDSSLVAVIATDAVGADKVHGVSMPSRFSSDHSVADAKALAENLGIHWQQIPIETAHAAFLKTVDEAPDITGGNRDLAFENIQARIRGTLLMALSNLYDWLVLTTGNKSESAVGYSTLYGDTAGAFAVIKDLWKTEVYSLAKMRSTKTRNQKDKSPLIGKNVFEKPPSAELSPNQTDDQSLPPYDELDTILKALVEDDMTVPEATAAIEKDMSLKKEISKEAIKEVAKLLDRSEYKRRQVPPGVRISQKAFGKDRRLPITNFYS